MNKLTTRKQGIFNMPLLAAILGLAILFTPAAFAQTTYYVTGSGTTFYGRTGSATGTAITGANGVAIQNVINAIKTHAAKNPCTIQFGDGTNTLDIGTASFRFDGGSGSNETKNSDWGMITIKGKLTSSHYITFDLLNYVLLNSTADIENTYSYAADQYTAAIRNDGTGEVTISGGTISVNSRYAVWNSITSTTYAGEGTIRVTGGIISSKTSYPPVYNTNGYSATASGGVLFNYGASASDVTRSVTVTGNTVVFAWNKAAGNTQYAAGTSNDISASAATTAMWLNKDGKAGIYYANGTNTGFIAIDGITVNKSDPKTPTGLVTTYGKTLANVALPAGWSWMSPTDLVGAVGTQTHKAKYTPNTPADTENYNSLTNVDVSLEVKELRYYVITKSGTTYTATGETLNTSNTAIQTVIDAIRTNADGVDCVIQFENMPNTLDIGTAGIAFSGTWGLITLEGKLTSSSTTGTSTISLSGNVSVESTADIENTSTGYGFTNYSAGTLSISGGTVSANTGNAVRSTSASGKIIISNNATVTSKNTGSSDGTIYNSTDLVEITGGTITNTAAGNAIYNTSLGQVTISGGQVSAKDGYAIYSITGAITLTGGLVFAQGTYYRIINGTYDASSGNTAIVAWNKAANTQYSAGTSNDILTISAGTTAIWLNRNGKAGIEYANGTNTGFIEIEGITVNKYDPKIPTGLIATVGQTLADVALPSGWEWESALTTSVGAAGIQTHKAKFTPTDTYNYNALTGVDVSVAVFLEDYIVLPNGYNYLISQSGSTFTATGGKLPGGSTSNASIQTVINDIKTDANGAPCGIQFNGTDELDIGTGYITFNGGSSGTDWGKITISGKITGSNTDSRYGVIYLINGTNLESKADIRATGSGSAISSWSTTSSVTISGGEIKANNYAVRNTLTGSVTISGGTISAMVNYAVSNSDGSVIISDGEISAASYAVYNEGTGSVTINGGEIKATGNNGRAVYNLSNGSVTVNGGDIKADGNNGYAVTNSGSATINGGTVSATGGNGRAVYNNDIGSVTISGGTISSTGGDAVYNIGLATITGGTISATSNYAVNNVVQMAIIGGVDTVYYTGSATISGGLVFAQRESAIFGTYDASSGNPVIIGWNKPTETPVYNASSNTALTVSPSPATAVWQSKDGKAGIEYANGANTGFIEIDGVSVEDGTDPIRTPQLASNNIHAYAMGNSIVLQNLPSNAKVEVFGLNGKLITTSHSPLATSQSVSVHAKGIYIIKVTSRGVSLMPNVLRVAVR